MSYNFSSEQYLEVYGNLYYFIAQAEEISAIDKYAGFVLKKEGEEFVEQSANLFKYDLLYNPLRFESWQKLANIYDEVLKSYNVFFKYFKQMQLIFHYYDNEFLFNNQFM